MGLFALGAGIFGVTAVGMGAMAAIVAVGVAKGELDPSPQVCDGSVGYHRAFRRSDGRIYARAGFTPGSRSCMFFSAKTARFRRA